jgi:hypothetical protein
MEQYKLCPTNQRPCPGFTVPSEVFTNAWYKVWKNRNSDITELLEISKELITYWEKLLTNPDYPKDINYITLCQLISGSPKKAINLIKRYVIWCKDRSSVFEELQLLLINYIRNCNYFPAKASYVMAEYVIMNNFKYRLGDEIRRGLRLKQSELLIRSRSRSIPEEEVEDNYTDVFLLKNLNLNDFESIILDYELAGYNLNEIGKLIYHHREYFYYKEKDLWHRIRTIYSDQ